MIKKLFRFGVTGFIGLCIDFTITYLCKEQLKWNKFLANATGFTAAVCNNYLINRIWTFENSDPHIARQFTYFLLISLFGLLLNTTVLYLLNERNKINFYVSKVLAVLVVFAWNFAANSYITFNYG